MTPRPLCLGAELRARLAELCVQALPREACGLLLGRLEAEAAEVTEVLAARNLAPDPLAGFEVHPEDHLEAHVRARSLGLEVLGAWHSHPRGGSRPSRRDREDALAAWWHLIAAMGAGGVEDLRAWRLVDGAMVEQPLPLGPASG